MSGIPAGAGQLLGKRLGKFEILALLALGGTAEIYLARIGGAAGFEKYVVVKCLHDHLADDAEFVKMFLDEARLAAHLDHSNIVQTMELGQHDGRYYMVMEFLAGLSLAMIVRRAAERMPNGRIPVPLVLNMLAQACAGLHYAHEKAMNGKALNIVHRDISPQNLVISFEGVVKVVDFGIAKAELRETHTRSGTIKGKFAYMSPEQCVANNVDRRTDVFALGVIGHELLTGRRLFKRPSPYETYQAVMECDVKPPSTLELGIDPALDTVLMRAVTKDKDARYPTAEAFGDALLGYLHHRGIGSGPGDVSRYFDAHFSQEIDEHSGRMRELISGRELPVDTGATWGVDDAEDEAAREAHDAEDASADAGDSAQRPAGAQPAPQRQSVGSLSSLIDDLGGGSRVEADDEMPAERTRIESNPLERINELDRLVSEARAAAPGAQRLPPSGALALPDPPQRSAPVPGMPASGRFPDLANLPTMIAASDSGSAPATSAALVDAPTSIAPAGGPPGGGFAPLPPPMPMGGLPGGFAPLPPPPGAAPLGATAFAHQPPSVAPMGPSVSPYPSGPPSPAHPELGNGAPPGSPRPLDPNALGYPVMNAQLSEQIATGATVFPSETRGAPPFVPQPGPNGPGPNGAGPNGPQGPQAQHGGPRGPAYGGPPEGYPHPPPVQGSGPQGVRDFQDAQRAAGVMSPVGQGYGGQVDWDAAAASPARAVKPWLLAVLFVGAIGIALILTIVIARLVF